LASAFIALVVGAIYMVILRYLAGFFIWFALGGLFLFLLLLGLFFLFKAEEKKKDLNLIKGTDAQLDQSKDIVGLEALGYLCLAIMVLGILFFISQYKNLKMAIAIIKSATNFIGSNIRVLFIPPILSIFLLAWFALWYKKI
jgi:hypothetical protein